MTRVLDTQANLDTVCQLLKEGETSVAVPVAGGSMIPFLHHGDTVYLDLPRFPLKQGDVLLYQRSNGQYILHRLIKVNADGSLWMCGDAQRELEYLPNTACVRGLVTSACHKGKTSHVVSALGLDKRTAAGVIRLSFGPETTKEDIDAAYEALKEHKENRFAML